jgi:hypothetical protein
MRKSHLDLLQRLEGAFRNLLKVPNLSPEEIVGLAGLSGTSNVFRFVPRTPRL